MSTEWKQKGIWGKKEIRWTDTEGSIGKIVEREEKEDSKEGYKKSSVDMRR